jgi:hypothetical protein
MHKRSMVEDPTAYVLESITNKEIKNEREGERKRSGQEGKGKKKERKIENQFDTTKKLA